MRRLLYPFYRLKYRNKLLVSTTKAEINRTKPAHYGQRMPSSLAAIGLIQLQKLDQINAERRLIAIEWDKWCEENQYSKPLVLEQSEPVFLRYPIIVSPNKKQDTTWTKPLKIEVGDWFRTHLHPANYEINDCPQAMIAVTCCINLPTI